MSTPKIRQPQPRLGGRTYQIVLMPCGRYKVRREKWLWFWEYSVLSHVTYESAIACMHAWQDRKPTPKAGKPMVMHTEFHDS